MYGYIYKITFPVGSFNLQNGEPFYIGQKKSKTIDDHYFGSGTKVKHWFSKHGLNSRYCEKDIIEKLHIKKEILKICETKEELNTAEFEIVNQVLGTELCLNLRPGGMRAGNYPLESKQRFRESAEKTGNLKLGALKAAEVNKKITKNAEKREQRRKRKIESWNLKSVRCVETGEVFDNAHRASTETNIRHIDEVCKGCRKTAGGFHWEYV